MLNPALQNIIQMCPPSPNYGSTSLFRLNAVASKPCGLADPFIEDNPPVAVGFSLQVTT